MPLPPFDNLRSALAAAAALLVLGLALLGPAPAGAAVGEKIDAAAALSAPVKR